MKNWAKAIRISALLVSAGMLGGCANEHFLVKPVLHHSQNANTDNGNQQAANTGANRYLKEPIDLDKEGSQHKRLYDAARNQDGRPSRNELQNRIIELSDDVCEQHKGDVIGNASQINLATGLGATVLSSVAAIVTGAAAANYATGATILNGAKTAVSADIYQGLFTTAIIKAIEESRGKKKNEILAKQLKNTDEYSVDTAVVDAQDYHFRCSFYHGLVVLNEDSKKRATPSRAELLGKIEVLRKEIEVNDKQKGINSKEAPGNNDSTYLKMQQGIDALYDKLNTTE